MRQIALVGTAVAVVVALLAAPTASAERAIGLRADGTLLEFDTATPGFDVQHPITGVGAGEHLQSIAYRPSDGRVYGVSAESGSKHRLYTLDPNTGAATLVGPAAGADFLSVNGIDFDPVADELRVTDYLYFENGRINPATGARADLPNDTKLSAFNISGIAYAPGSAPGLTTLYAIRADPGNPTLGIIGGIDGSPSPNLGVYTPLAPLGAVSDNAAAAPFDISAQTGIGYAVLINNIHAGFYRINPAAAPGPVATLIGPAGSEEGKGFIRGLAIMPGDGPKPPPAQLTCQGKAVTVPGTDGADSLKGTNGRDVIAGLGGNDKVVAGGGNDVVCGGDGNDNINGNAGKDKLYGEAGKDKLNGSGGKGDVCNGGPGKDKGTGSCEKAPSA
ncbi:MAG: hypothetical protein QOG62_720 [Thermoleophilaceae bacterium]|nr:hypothetical protein [Thermoleophilaceae bacterium]